VIVTLGAIAHEAYLKAAGWWSGLPPEIGRRSATAA